MARRNRREDFAQAISFGAFLILIALFYVATPNVLDEVKGFIRDFKPIQVSRDFPLLEPSTNHPVLYNAAGQFCYLFSLVQVAVLVLTFAKESSVRRKAATFSNIIFWLGAGYLFNNLSSGTLGWIAFLGALIVLLGISIVARSTVLLFAFRRQS